jgi:anti-sigma factor RsiW
MSAYLDGELQTGSRRRMEDHLGECVECRRLIAGLRLVIGALHRLPVPGSGLDRAPRAMS